MSNISFNPNVSATGMDALDSTRRASIVSDEDQASFESMLGTAPQANFSTLFNNLFSADQQKISQSLESFNQATNNSKVAFDEANAAFPTDLNNEAQVSSYLAKTQTALATVPKQVDTGLAMLDTLKNVDPALLQSSPMDVVGAGIISLMITSGTYPNADLKGLAGYFSISPELILQSLKTSGGTADQIAQAAQAFGVPVPA